MLVPQANWNGLITACSGVGLQLTNIFIVNSPANYFVDVSQVVIIQMYSVTLRQKQ